MIRLNQLRSSALRLRLLNHQLRSVSFQSSPNSSPTSTPINYERRIRPADRRTALAATRSDKSPDRNVQHRQNGQDFDDSRFLADRVKLLCSRSQYDQAIDLVKTSIVTNVVVWNVLLHEILLDRKFKRSFELWMDMKRRGVKPNVRSYTTFFNGHVKIKEMETASLARVKSVFAQWELYAQGELDRIEEQQGGGGKKKRAERSFGGQRSYEDMEDEPVSSKESSAMEAISCIPTNAYLHFLGNTKNLPLLLTTFEAMPSTGLLAPDATTYSTVLSALRSSSDPEHFKVAMKLWRHMLDQKRGAIVDTMTVSVIISICRETARPDDQKIGLDVAQQFYGLVPPALEDTLVSPTLPAPLVPLDSAALSNVFSLALKMQQYNLVTRWFDQMRDYPKRFDSKRVLESWHCDLVYLALAAKKDASGAEGSFDLSLVKTFSTRCLLMTFCADLLNYQRASPLHSPLQPTLSSYTNAIQVCWRSADLIRASKILELMTGKRMGGDGTLVATVPTSAWSPPSASASASTSTSTKPAAKKSLHKTFSPDERILSTLLQTALATKNRGEISRSIELAEAHGFGREFYTQIIQPSSSSSPSTSSNSSLALSHNQFWRYKLSEVFERSIDRLLQSTLSSAETELSLPRRRVLSLWRGEIVRWLEAQEVMNKAPKSGEDGEETMKGRREVLKEREEKRKVIFEAKLKSEKMVKDAARALRDEEDVEERNESRNGRDEKRSTYSRSYNTRDDEEDRGFSRRSSSSSFSAPPARNNDTRSSDRYTFTNSSESFDNESVSRRPAPSPLDLAQMEKLRTQAIEDWPSMSAPHPDESAQRPATPRPERRDPSYAEKRAFMIGSGDASYNNDRSRSSYSSSSDRRSGYGSSSGSRDSERRFDRGSDRRGGDREDRGGGGGGGVYGRRNEGRYEERPRR